MSTEPKRVIPGCAHTPERMAEWSRDGACPICLSAMAGMRRDALRLCLPIVTHMVDRNPQWVEAREALKAAQEAL